MSSIDERVVEMRFDNAAFQKGIDTSMKSLTELDKSLSQTNGTKAFDGMGDSVGGLSAKFSALQIAGVTALATLVNKAVDAGIRIAKSLVVEPISDGWSDYNLKLTSVQTVMNATGKSIDVVNGHFNELDDYADKTIYNLTDMTSAFAKFTNAGIKMDTSVTAIKGIANAVALAGQDAGAAQIAFYNLSQSLAGGFLTTTDYKSLNLANVATKELKDYIVQTAVAMGTLKKVGKGTYDIVAEKGKDAYKMADLFNGKLSEGWATSKVLLKTFGDFGDITTDVGKKALAAAQNVKSLPMMMDTLKAAVGTTWTESFEYIFGNVEESTKMFTDLTIRIQTLLDMGNEFRNNILKGWKQRGGRDSFINSINNILDAITNIAKPMQQAWAAIFPNRNTIDALTAITQAFERFTKKLILSDKQMEVLKNTLTGIFAIFRLVGSVIGTVFRLIGAVLKPILSIFKLTGDGANKLSKNFADWAQNMLLAYQNSKFLKMVSVRAKEMGEAIAKYVRIGVEWLQKGVDAIKAFIAGFKGGEQTEKFGGNLKKLNEIGIKFGLWLRGQKKHLEKAITWFTNFKNAFTNYIMQMLGKINLLKKDDSGATFFDKLKNGFKSFIDFLPKVVDVLKNVIDFIKKAFEGAKNVGTTIGNIIKSIWDAIRKVIGGVDPNVALGTLNLGLFVVAAKTLSDLFGPGIEVLNSFSDAMKAIKAEILTRALLNVAFAVLIFAAALLVLSKVPRDQLGEVAAVMGIMTVVMVGVMKQIKTMTKELDGTSIIPTVIALTLVAGALLLMAHAAKIFSTVSAGGFAAAAVGIILLVGALKVLQMAKIDGPNMIRTAGAMAILGAAMIILAGGIKVMSLLSYDTFESGMVRIAVALAALALGMKLFPEAGAIQGAAAIAIIAGAMMLLAQSIKMFAALDEDAFFNGIIRITAALLLLIGSLNLMKANMQQVAALALMIASLAALAEIIKVIGALPTGDVVQALIAIGFALGLLVAAALVLTNTGAFVALYALAAVIASIGVAVLGVGLGIYYFVSAFEKLIEIGQKGAPVIIQALTNLAQAIPAFVALIIGFFVNLMKQLASNIDEILSIVVSILISVLNSLRPVVAKAIDFIFDVLEDFFTRLWAYLEKMAPLWAESATKMIAGFIQGIADNIDLVINAATDLIVNFLNGLQASVPLIMDAATDLIVAFLEELERDQDRIGEAATSVITSFIAGLGENALKIITAAGDTLITFLNGIEDWIRNNTRRIQEAGAGIGDAIIDGLTGGLRDGIGRVANAAQNVINNLTGGVRKLLGIASPSKVFKAIGDFVMKGFAEGLKSGDKKYVQDVWTTMRKSLKEFVTDANADIKKHKARLKELQKDRKKNAKAIKEEEKAIAKLRKERDQALATYKYMDKHLKDERDRLKKLAAAYEKVTEKLEAAQDALADARQERADYQASTKDSLDDFLTVDAETKLDDFMTAMHKQLDDMQNLRNALETVRAMGLNDKLYKQLVEGGIDSIPFLDQLINGGQAAVAELNQMSHDLDVISKGLGDDASSNLYDAGVAMAEGLVKGLESEQAKLKAQMEALAKHMVDAIKKELKIKSPSQVLEEVGEYTAEGLIKGLKASADMVADASESVASEAVSAFEKVLGEIKDTIPDDMDLNPVITPVLDLSKVHTESAKLDSMLYNKQLQVDTSTANAAVVAAAVKASQEMTSTDVESDMVSAITFIQNNNSPKELSPSEIYRQTNNQLSRAKGALSP